MDTDVAIGHKMGSHGLFERTPFFILNLLVFLLPFFFIPNILLSPAAAKGILLFVFVALIVISWVLSILRTGTVSLPRVWIPVVLGVLSFVYLVSSVFSGQIGLSLIGDGFITDTFMSVFAGTLLVLLIPAIVITRRDALTMYVSVVAGFVVLTLAQLVHLIGGPDTFTLSVLFTPVSNLLGKWNDIGVLSGLVLLLSVLTLEMLRVSKTTRVFLYVISLLSVFFLALVQFLPAWYVVGTFSLLLVLYRLSVRGPSSGNTSSRGSVSVLAVSVVVLSIIFIFAGRPIDATLTDQFNTAQVEVRPSLQATWSIASDVFKDSPVFGVGPNRFSEAWFLYKPDGVNQTAFWGVAFNLGIGFIPTSLVTVGALGFAGWIVFFVMLLLLGARSVFRRFTDPISQYLIMSSFLASLYLWVFLTIYTPGIALLTLAFIFTGLFISALYQAKILRSWTFSFSEHTMHNFVGALIAVAMIITVGVGGYTAAVRFIGNMFNQQGIAHAQTGDIDAAESSLVRALQFSEQASFYRTLAEIQTVQLNLLLQRGDTGADVLRNQFQSSLTDAITSAQRATAIGGNDYQNWMTLGRIYEELVPIGIEGSYESAMRTYERARLLNPKGPDVFLALARLESRNGDNTSARERIADALGVKSNYTDAVFLLSQIEIAEGNVAGAIRSVEAATIIEPNNSVIFFQLGLLRYSSDDFAGAASAFESAVGLNTVYANARYFLGLSYDRLERRQDSITQFERVQELNPDNQEVVFILENLRDDQPPFANVQPPLDDEPESRTELPADEPIVEEEDSVVKETEE